MPPDELALTIPEPPSINAMIGYAKAWGQGRKYYAEQQKYRDAMELIVPSPPAVAWEKYEIVSAHFRLWNWRDPLELLAGLKWPLDLLVNLGWLLDDDRNCLLGIPLPTQEIKRNARGVDILIRRVP